MVTNPDPGTDPAQWPRYRRPVRAELPTPARVWWAWVPVVLGAAALTGVALPWIDQPLESHHLVDLGLMPTLLWITLIVASCFPWLGPAATGWRPYGEEWFDRGLLTDTDRPLRSQAVVTLIAAGFGIVCLVILLLAVAGAENVTGTWFPGLGWWLGAAGSIGLAGFAGVAIPVGARRDAADDLVLMAAIKEQLRVQKTADPPRRGARRHR